MRNRKALLPSKTTVICINHSETLVNDILLGQSTERLMLVCFLQNMRRLKLQVMWLCRCFYIFRTSAAFTRWQSNKIRV